MALEINNYNDYQKCQKTEQIIIKEISDNLTIDLLDFNNNISHLENQIVSSKSLLRVIDKNIPYNDSLGYFFSCLKMYPHFTAKTDGYALLQSKGLEIIQNDVIRKAITSLYEERYKYLLVLENERINYNLLVLENVMKPYNGTETLTNTSIPKSLTIQGSFTRKINNFYFRNLRNFKAFKQDKNLHGLIKDIEVNAIYLKTIHSNYKQEVVDLISTIKTQMAN